MSCLSLEIFLLKYASDPASCIFKQLGFKHVHLFSLAVLTVSKRPGTSYQIEIHFAVVNHFRLLFSFVKLVET